MAKGFTPAKRGMVAVIEKVHSSTGAGFKRETWSDYTIVCVKSITRDGYAKEVEAVNGSTYAKVGKRVEWSMIWIINNVQWADIEPALKKRRGGGVFNDLDACKEWLRKFKTPKTEG